MIKKLDKNIARKKRHARIRRTVKGTEVRPRLNVFRSGKHIYAQLIDDNTGNTLISASTIDPEIKASTANGGNIEAAQKVGQVIAKRAQEKGFDSVVFDRGGYLYHGRVQALAEAAREAGLKF